MLFYICGRTLGKRGGESTFCQEEATSARAFRSKIASLAEDANQKFMSGFGRILLGRGKGKSFEKRASGVKSRTVACFSSKLKFKEPHRHRRGAQSLKIVF